MITKHVVVLPYDEKWKRDFITIKDELTEALGDMAITIEHVGSTSVEGLAAKPIIDIEEVHEGCLYRDGTFCVPIEGLETFMKYLDQSI